MQKGISFVGLMDLGTLDALKASAAKAPTLLKESPKRTEYMAPESKETAHETVAASEKGQVSTTPQPC